MSFLLYMVGYVVFVAGLAWLATVVGVANGYVTMAAIVLLGVGVLTGLAQARVKEPPAA